MFGLLTGFSDVVACANDLTLSAMLSRFLPGSETSKGYVNAD